MKPNELRLGNLFYPINRSGHLHIPIEIPFKILSIGNEVEAVKFDQIPAQLEQIPKFSLRDLSEIPLSKKWFEIFGFQEHAISYFNRNSVVISYANTGLHEYRCRDFPIIIRTVHQLQNLYFALTGEELELSPVESA